MLTSEARLAANKQNATRSKGPTSPEGRAISRMNSLKHGLTGEGIVVAEDDQQEVASRAEAFNDAMKPRSPAGMVLVLQMATLSVRMERAGQQEFAAIALNVRHAAENFDQERIDRAEALFETLGENPRGILRKLKRMPEGVDVMIDAWGELRNDLRIDPRPLWTAAHLEQAANMTGLKTQHARGSRLGALSRGFWGDFEALGDGDGGNLEEEARQNWAKVELLKLIDAEIVALEAHRETLDFKMIERDRAGAGDRALFDCSKEATLARRYESEASRRFYKALDEFRKVEAEFDGQVESMPACPEPEEVGSFCEPLPRPEPDLVRSLPEAPPLPVPAVQDPEPKLSRRARRAKLRR
jgi:hypothetical protein